MIDKLLLFPYWVALKTRHLMFDCGLRKQHRTEVPSICVGNIAVGGTGKTPHTEMILRTLLADEDWSGKNIAVLSRGYKRKTKGFQQVTYEGTAAEYGDEPLQIKEKFPDTLLIFIATKDAAEMERRLTGRGTESFDQITGRLKAAVGEAEQMQHYDYVVINDDLQECVEQMNGIILTEPEGPRYDPAFKEQFVKDLEEIVAKRTVQ